MEQQSSYNKFKNVEFIEVEQAEKWKEKIFYLY